MTDEQNMSMDQNEFMKRMKAIASDLWGGILPAEESVPAPANKPAEPARKEPEKPKAALQSIWKTADETIDWTDALAHDTPTDGLTGMKKWTFYHKHAARVLEGDLEAYVEVLTTLNPLGDLTDYVNGMLLRAPGAERLECEFECRPEEIEKDARGYLGALSVRIARDLLAVLPVEEVHVLGRMNGNDQLDVTFRRSQMLKRKMAFLIPADFVEECGGRLEG